MKFYIDDEVEGLSRKTSHSNFNLFLKAKFYTSIIDEFSPFGNDEGWDTLRALEDWYRTEYKEEDSLILDFITDYGLSNWGWSEEHLPMLQIFDLKKIKEIEEEEEFFFTAFPQMIIATAFGQIKITGKLDDYLEEITQKVIKQQILITNHKIKSNFVDISKLLKIVEGKTTRLNENGGMNKILKIYIERLLKMSKDLKKIPLINNEEL